ncbi:hypothetical protein [Micromonospora sp. NBC_01813]|uniref:hypothetical protein n=1 Tax=Micromonospora sp. NBC_01813 TaxID=2975988 RepID=UPI002DD81BF4|nr:hypothetical protein [Micromonospora sp. NBC_01813]WSA12361.1 hypothetical protein OG958_17175 [Micromonospora sp. NBC_01813]
MRRTLIPAVLASALAVALAGCGGDSDPAADPTPQASASASAATESTESTETTDAATATKEACDMAVPVAEETASTIDAYFAEFIAAVTEGGTAAETADAEFRAKFAGFSGMLESLAVDPVDADVQQALTEGAEFAAQIIDPDDNTPMGQVEGRLVELAENLKAACA